MAHLSAEESQALRRSFGERVRVLREHRELSQERLAEHAGVHRTYVSSVERGHRNIGLENIHAFANALAVSPAQFFEEG
ncbi:MAG: helix-turn-helix domain-containing protein [Pseudonocardiaceae bacterium]